jgi:hypothetical protein
VHGCDQTESWQIVVVVNLLLLSFSAYVVLCFYSAVVAFGPKTGLFKCVLFAFFSHEQAVVLEILCDFHCAVGQV